jgi:hypothetical protein
MVDLIDRPFDLVGMRPVHLVGMRPVQQTHDVRT